MDVECNTQNLNCLFHCLGFDYIKYPFQDLPHTKKTLDNYAICGGTLGSKLNQHNTLAVTNLGISIN